MRPKNKLWTEYENHLLNLQVTKRRMIKLDYMFHLVSRRLNLGTAKRPEVEAFVNDLNRDKFKRLDGKPYSGSAKSDIKKFLKQYYKHTLGKDEFYPPEVSWLKTKIAKDEKPKEKPVIELKDAVKLAQSFKKYEFKILTLLLFDSGFRISEALSIKKKDITFEPFEGAKKCFWVKCNVSKTFTRKVPVPLFQTEIASFCESSYYTALEQDSPVFPFEARSYAQMLKEHGLKLFKLKLTPHCLRHSSATYYAKEYAGNVPMLAQRFGWSFSANELQTYVRTSGAYNKEGAKVSFHNEVVELKEQNRILTERLDRIEKMILAKAKAEILSKKSLHK